MKKGCNGHGRQQVIGRVWWVLSQRFQSCDRQLMLRLCLLLPLKRKSLPPLRAAHRQPYSASCAGVQAAVTIMTSITPMAMPPSAPANPLPPLKPRVAWGAVSTR